MEPRTDDLEDERSEFKTLPSLSPGLHKVATVFVHQSVYADGPLSPHAASVSLATPEVMRIEDARASAGAQPKRCQCLRQSFGTV